MSVYLVAVTTTDRPLSVVPIYVDYYKGPVNRTVYEARVPWTGPAYTSEDRMRLLIVVTAYSEIEF